MSGGTGRRVGAFFVSFLLLGACPRTKPGLSLGDGPGMFIGREIEKRILPLCDVPQICLGGQPIDDGNLTLTEEEKDELLKVEKMREFRLASSSHVRLWL